MAKRVARKIKRAGKVACQFKFTSTFEYIDLECKGGWRPDNLKVIWLRSHRRAQSMNVEWVCTDDKGPGASGRAVFDPPISASLLVTLYKDSKKPYEEKEYKYYIENEGPGGKKILASFTCDMAEYAGIPSSRHALEMNFKPISSKIKKCYLGITLESEFVKQGNANDDDMQSTFSAVEPGGEEMVFADEVEEDEDDEDDLDEAATLGKKIIPNMSSESNDIGISLIMLGTGETLKRSQIDVQAPPPKPPRSSSMMDLLDESLEEQATACTNPPASVSGDNLSNETTMKENNGVVSNDNTTTIVATDSVNMYSNQQQLTPTPNLDNDLTNQSVNTQTPLLPNAPVASQSPSTPEIVGVVEERDQKQSENVQNPLAPIDPVVPSTPEIVGVVEERDQKQSENTQNPLAPIDPVVPSAPAIVGVVEERDQKQSENTQTPLAPIDPVVPSTPAIVGVAEESGEKLLTNESENTQTPLASNNPVSHSSPKGDPVSVAKENKEDCVQQCLSNQSENMQTPLVSDGPATAHSPSTEPETNSTDDTPPTDTPTVPPTDPIDDSKANTQETSNATPDVPPQQDTPPENVLSWLQDIELVDSTDSPIGLDRLASAEVVAFYFSASWCPPCKTFLPNLKKFYSALKDNNKSFEMVYVSSDYSREEMVAYMEESSMPWTAIRYGHKLADKLRQDYTVRVIPILVVVSRSGMMVEENAKKQVDKAASASSATAACIQLYSNWVEKINNPSATTTEEEPVKQKTGIMTSIKKALSKDEDKKNVSSLKSGASIDVDEIREATESKTPKSKINSGGNKEDLLRQLQEKENVIRQLEEVNLSLKHTNDDLNTEVRQLKSRVELLNEEVKSLRETDAQKKEDDEMFREYLKLQGWLFKRGAKGPTANKWRRRYFRLDQGSKLYYYKNHTEGTPQGHIDLLKVVSVMELTAAQQDKNNASFNVECEGRTFQLLAYDEAEMRRWITAIGKLKEFYCKQQKEAETE